MVAAAWCKSNSFVAYPIEVLYTPAGDFAGFTMRRVGGHKPERVEGPDVDPALSPLRSA